MELAVFNHSNLKLFLSKSILNCDFIFGHYTVVLCCHLYATDELLMSVGIIQSPN